MNAVCNMRSSNSIGHTGNGKQGVPNPDGGIQTELQRENDKLRGTGFLCYLTLYADSILDSTNPGSPSRSQPSQDGSREG